ncbi:MAG TPA: flagellar assembly peptidoglycan hydrolase FlgJ [Accumulibacter sp.]|uniref:flagellar assembly peptidoglycan hydrolase FlgJ n=1 Tax=Accumulibacter sp. TaxID=2053492 RepID=UPI0025DC1305|nr:flagellar assembly peptidoglycan hydrolase FlgJ [Accumulibacter sp.]MCM8598724.1 flagellar assembly peptidoglycan hydrolase FlgJ [Accumulibacter sp.]MCM8662784.1 flagellar assembly peptidoglycan hydrolase FlgJ [Accumulibacter sp.]HNC50927.1 flagellar assembly peptidoglycan hydrolase FlgJ [Accumulibacter sp.]
MRSSDPILNRLAIDPAVANDLRTRLRQDPQGGAKATARQFEGMLMHVMLKSMRDASPQGSLLDNEQSRFFTAIGDQQLAQNLAAQAPLGFANSIERQLQRQLAGNAAASAGLPDAASPPAARLATTRVGAERPVGRSSAGTPIGATAPAASASTRDFADQVRPYAVDAAALTGVPADFLVAHAALESGWGKHEIRNTDGTRTFNLFGIKAGRKWSGPTVEASTTEFVNGQAQSVRAKFRVYASYAEAFEDYGRLLSSNPRFAGVIGQQDGAQFARALQQAGYATDPLYAEKLTRVIGATAPRPTLAAT